MTSYKVCAIYMTKRMAYEVIKTQALELIVTPVGLTPKYQKKYAKIWK